MKRGFYIYAILLLLLTAAACEKTDPEPLSGDILGRVTVFNQDGYVLEDQSDVRVVLKSEGLQTGTVTNPPGEFAFLGIKYGNYSIYPEKDGFAPTMGEDDPVHHLGGYNPTRVSYHLNEIPRFGLEIDSAQIDFGFIRLWLKFEDWNGEPKNWYSSRCFFSGSPEVSKDAFYTHSQGWIFGNWIENDRYEALLENYILYQIDADSIYLCIYPEALGQSLYAYKPESLGKASKVLALKNPFLEQ